MTQRTNQTELDAKAKLFRGFSDPSRLKIIETLRGGALTVSEIVRATALSQPNVSNHLGCLRDCGLVVAERNGRFMNYYLSDDRVSGILTLTESLLADAAHTIYECTRYAHPQKAAQ